MSSKLPADRTPTPATIDSLTADLAALGVKAGMALLVHSSLSALGWVNGGAPAVILALEQVLGAEGTLIMPTHSGDLSDPAGWRNPPIPEAWWETVRQTMPPFDAALTCTWNMGAIPEAFRKQRRVVRSNHPQLSFAAWGKYANWVTGGHSLAMGLGDESPLARVYDLDGSVLLLGVGHENNTSLHLAEARAVILRRMMRQGAPVMVKGKRKWVWYDDLDWNSDDFPQIGADFASATSFERVGQVAQATARLMPQRPLVDYTVSWMEARRVKVAGAEK